MKIILNDQHADHDVQSELHNGKLVRSFECPERLAIIKAALMDAGHNMTAPSVPHCPRQVLEAVHTPAYLDFLASAWERWSAQHRGTTDALGFTWPTHGLRKRAQPPKHIDALMGYYSFCVDTGVNVGTWAAASEGARVAHQAALDGKAFALTRPPGHHAHADMYGGYCFINNAAVAVETFRANGAKRVAVLDVDYHHGNGTQAIFYQDADVLTISLHADPDFEFPYFLGFADERGEGAGEGTNLNLPMPFGTDYGQWSQRLDYALAAIDAFGADAIVIPLGVDTYHDDPISQFKFQPDDFTRLGERLGKLGLTSVITMEGGYATEALGQNVAKFVGGFVG